MSEDNLLKLIRTEFNSSAPDNFEDVLKKIESYISDDDRADVIHADSARKNIFLRIAASAAILAVSALAFNLKNANEPFRQQETVTSVLTELSVTTVSRSSSDTSVTKEHILLTSSNNTTVSENTAYTYSESETEYVFTDTPKSSQFHAESAVSEPETALTNNHFLFTEEISPDTQSYLTSAVSEEIIIPDTAVITEASTAPPVFSSSVSSVPSESQSEVITQIQTSEETLITSFSEIYSETEYEPSDIHAVLIDNPLWHDTGSHTSSYLEGEQYIYEVQDIDRYRIRVWYDGDKFETFSLTRALGMKFVTADGLIDAGLPYISKKEVN